ncbi:Hint domain-containing protein [Anianabacter salinae]|uniref:Hint domain-containing protein n=1 Tax=Anianabacter salinae TaxID=2851023 RepID=UPI00225E5C3B|nr:Hint domain-containing protein [Anianabacter salinae]MBV0912000.1 Hint domain-containing protein [Anianabacter salinae]
MGTADLTIYPYNGSVAGLYAGGLVNSNLINSAGGGRAATISDLDGTLSQSDNLVSTLSIPADGVSDVPITYIGAGTFSTISLLGIRLDTRPVAAFEAGGQVYLVAPSGFPILSGLSLSFDIDANTPFTLPNFMPCFVAGTMILTPSGARAIETLKAGDLVRDIHGNDLPIVWTGGRTVTIDRQKIDETDTEVPVLVPRDHFGRGAPDRPTLVSQHHRLVIRPKALDRRRALARAKLLVDHGLALSRQTGPVEYRHILLDRHAVLIANGMEAESLLLGRMTASAVGPVAWKDILHTVPAAREPGYTQRMCLPDLGRGALARIMRSERADT